MPQQNDELESPESTSSPPVKPPAPPAPPAAVPSEEPEDDFSELGSSRHLIREVTREMLSIWSGPLPPPESFGRYEEILPGAADRILTMAEDQSRHRRQMETASLRGKQRLGLFGLMTSFYVFMGLLAIATIATVMGQPVYGLPIGGIGLLAFLAPIVTRAIGGWGQRNGQSDA